MVKVSGTATIKQSETGEIYETEGGQFSFKRVYVGRRNMRTQTYFGVLKHPQIGEISCFLFEYPVGVKKDILPEHPYKLIEDNLHFEFPDENETPTHQTFSEREKTKQQPAPYQYNEIPEELHIKILYILDDAVEDFTGPFTTIRNSDELWGNIWNIYCRKKGIHPRHNHARLAKLYCREIIGGKDLEDIKGNGLKDTLDIIEIMFWFMESGGVRQGELDRVRNQLNDCFLKESFGYRINGNQIMRIDSEFPYREIIKPVLVLLQGKEFESANKEFLSAHEHYLNGGFEESIVYASSAFETVIKTICDGKKWNYGSKVGKNLVLFLLDKDEFIPKYLRSHFEQLLPTLWSGLFVTRNNHPPGHGQGKKTEVYAYMAGYALHLAATNILLLVQIYESQKHSKVS